MWSAVFLIAGIVICLLASMGLFDAGKHNNLFTFFIYSFVGIIGLLFILMGVL